LQRESSICAASVHCRWPAQSERWIIIVIIATDVRLREPLRSMAVGCDSRYFSSSWAIAAQLEAQG
jgi:hypothetical protein